ncbi:MAG: glycosyltransferase family 39 protein [Pseudomonadota bacterium]
MTPFSWLRIGMRHNLAAETEETHPGWDWTIAFDGTKTTVKTVLFILVCIVWVLPGLIGHEPWKGDEAATFGAVYHIVQTGNWLVPMLAGEPFLERPPLYYVVAALFAKSFSFALPLHDAARLASGFFNAITVLFITLAGRALLGERFGRVTAIILLGTLGLLLRLHEMVSDTALLAGFTMGFYGLAIALIKPRLGGLCLGLGIAISFLARGFLGPSLLGATALALPIFFRHWRTRGYLQFFTIAMLVAIPLCLAWPAALKYRSPALFNQWFYINNWDALHVHILSGIPEAAMYYLRIFPWYTWPTLPLALWALWQSGKSGLTRPEILLPITTLVMSYVILAMTPDVREIRALPFLIPLAVLGAAGIDTIRRGATSALDWFGMMTFGLFSAGLWLGWIALRIGEPEVFVAWVKNYQPGFEMPFKPIAFAAAVVLSVIYIATVTRTRRSNRRAIVSWTTGITAFWMLAMTLWLPLIDESRSYRSTMVEMRQALPEQYNCLASSNLGEAQRALLDYYAGLVTKRIENNEGGECRILLVQGVSGKEPPLSVLWVKIWEGNRPGDKIERLRLYRRDS